MNIIQHIDVIPQYGRPASGERDVKIPLRLKKKGEFMRKKFEPILRFFRRLAKAMKSSFRSGFSRRAGVSVKRVKAWFCSFFMGLWKNWNSAKRAGLLRRMTASLRKRKEAAILLVHSRVPDRESLLHSMFFKKVTALALMVLVTVGSVGTVMAATHSATVLCDGVASRVEMTSPETAQILLKAGVKTSPGDLIARSDDPNHAGDAVISVKTARKVSVEADGTVKTVVVHYGDTVSDVLKTAGVTLDSDDLVTPAESKLVKDGDKIQVTRMVQVTIAADGSEVSATVRAGSVSEAIRQAGVQLGPEDTLSVALDERVSAGMKIGVSRVAYKEGTETRSIPFQSVTKKDASLPAGKTKILTVGENGSEQVVVRQKLIEGKVTGTQDVSTTVVKQPVSQVTAFGTKRSAVTAISSNGTALDGNGRPLHFKRVLTGRCSCYTGGGTTSTGAKAAFGRVAVNPSIIPYGTKLYICSPDGELVYGYAVAADTGGAAMRGAIIADLYYDSYSQCMKIGTRTMNVYIL